MCYVGIHSNLSSCSGSMSFGQCFNILKFPISVESELILTSYISLFSPCLLVFHMLGLNLHLRDSKEINPNYIGKNYDNDDPDISLHANYYSFDDDNNPAFT